jgi:lipopolysaccharide/colanic/teichoic acid biosynthesis glycosyltransferase
MSQIARALGIEAYSPTAEWRTLFRLKPTHRREFVYGFLLRLIVGLFAIAIPSICVMLIGALNGWHLTRGLLVFYGLFICTIILTGEHVRSRVYERFVKVVEPSKGVTGVDSNTSRVETITAEFQKGRLARPMSLTQRWLKRAFDVLFASFALIFLFPLLVVAAIVVKFESPGPVLFRQLRMGFNGRPFSILKFRTMSVDDGRLTRVGRYLRMTSIDELPQLVNVLIGDISVVGPRPHSMADDNKFQQALRNYAFARHVKPGLTGWAQVHGLRGVMTTPEHVEHRIEYDLWYIDNWSLRLDASILLKTAVEVLRRRDAY